MITAEDIACEAYGVVFPSDPVGEVPEPRAQHKPSVAVIRAMHSFVRKQRASLARWRPGAHTAGDLPGG